MARAYMAEFDITHEDLAAVTVKNHANGVDNPVAQFQKEVSVEDVLDVI